MPKATAQSYSSTCMAEGCKCPLADQKCSAYRRIQGIVGIVRHRVFSRDFLLQFVALFTIFTPICKCNVQESLGRTSACSLYAACLHRLV